MQILIKLFVNHSQALSMLSIFSARRILSSDFSNFATPMTRKKPIKKGNILKYTHIFIYSNISTVRIRTTVKLLLSRTALQNSQSEPYKNSMIISRKNTILYENCFKFQSSSSINPKEPPYRISMFKFI